MNINERCNSIYASYNSLSSDLNRSSEKTDLSAIIKKALATFQEAQTLCNNIDVNQVMFEDISKCMDLRDKIEKLIEKALEIQSAKTINKLENHPLVLISNPAAPFSAQISVTDQNTTKDTYVACGYHALKNSLISIALAYSNAPNKQLVSLFNDANFFNNEIHPFLNSFRTGAEGDITIATLTEGLNKILTGDFDKKRYPTLNQLSEILQNHQHSISILNMTPEDPDFNIPASIFGGQDSFSIDNITDTLKAIQQPGPLSHAFITGTNGHWVTLIMEKNQKGDIKWIGADSWKNDKDTLPQHKKLLDLVSNRDYIENNIHSAYNDAVGGTIQNLCRHVNNQGQPLSSSDVIYLTHDYQVILHNIHEIAGSYKFLNELGLKKSPNFAQDIQDLKSVALFYKNYLESLPNGKDEKTVDLFFSKQYPEFIELLESKVFELNELQVSSERFGQIKEVVEIAGVTVTEVLDMTSLEKYFDKYGNNLKKTLAPILNIKENESSQNYIGALKKLDSTMAKDILLQVIYELDRNRLNAYLEKHPVIKNIPALNPLSKNNFQALVAIKREALAYRKPDIMQAINRLKVEGTNKLIDQKEALKLQITDILTNLS